MAAVGIEGHQGPKARELASGLEFGASGTKKFIGLERRYVFSVEGI